MFIEAGWIDSWKRNWDESRKCEFVSFRVICRKAGGETWHFDRRYSQFLTFHEKTLSWFTENNILRESFPGKQPFQSQTDLFCERRAKALDAYLQFFLHACGKLRMNAEQEVIFKDFFGINERAESGIIDSKQPGRKSPSVARTPTGVNSEIDRLKRLLHENVDIGEDLANLQVLVRGLQEKRDIGQEDKRSIEKFYELKREWEIRRIKSGEFVFESGGESGKNEARKSVLDITKDDDGEKASSHSTQTQTQYNPTAKELIRGQEAILTDLAATLAEQKMLSKEIYAEVAGQNRIIGQVGQRQEDTKEGFIEATARARKLQ